MIELNSYTEKIKISKEQLKQFCKEYHYNFKNFLNEYTYDDTELVISYIKQL